MGKKLRALRNRTRGALCPHAMVRVRVAQAGTVPNLYGTPHLIAQLL